MSRARSALFVRVFLAVTLTGFVLASADAREAPASQAVDAVPLAAVVWPPSTGLLVSEVVTGGASASDEFVEIYNASGDAIDLAGLELVYVTSTGGTVTRKQTWTELAVPAHRHVLIANSSGVFASGADGTYSGGLSATGGTVALRVVAGEVIDSLSWGDASSSFVEGAAGAAPPASASLERKPGGAAGNATDSNDNSADALINASPVPQPLSAAPVPDGSASPSPTATTSPAATDTPAISPEPTGTSEPTLTPEPTPPCTPPTPTPLPTDTQAPTDAPTDSPTDSPTDEPVATQTAPADSATPDATLVPTDEPTDTHTPTASPSPSVVVVPIGHARTLAIGSSVAIRGVLTTPFGLLDGGRHAYLQDDSAGISLVTDFDPPLLPLATDLQVFGTLASFSGEMTLEIEQPADVLVVGTASPPTPLGVATGLACEPFEARLISVEGTLVAQPGEEADGVLSVIDDGSGPLPVFAASSSGVTAASLAAGSRVALVGVLGQISDEPPICRLIVRSTADVTVLQPPPTPTPTATASPTPTPTPKPTATPSAPASPITIAAARSQAVGTVVHVSGVVTAAAGVILDGSTIAIQDDTAGVYVRLPDATLAGIAPGTAVDVAGAIAAPYGNVELRPSAANIHVVGSAESPAPRLITMAQLGDSTEGLLAKATVEVDSIQGGSSGTLTLMVHDASGQGRVYFHEPLGVDHDEFQKGERIEVTGVVGDRLGLFRLWPRTREDVVMISPAPTPTPRPTPTPKPTATPKRTATPKPTATPRASATPGQPIAIAEALRRQGQVVTVEGVVTAKSGLLDTSGERVTIQDATAAVLLRLPGGASVTVGQKVRGTGTMGTYYGAPQLTASTVSSLGQASVSSTRISGAPVSPNLEWRLVSVSGTIDDVQRDGATWRAELHVSGGTVPIVGIERSGIASTVLVEGRAATIIGIVKRAYPTSGDQRLAIVPRSAADITIGAASASPLPAGSGRASSSAGPASYEAGGGTGGSSGPGNDEGRDGDGRALPTPVVTVIAALEEHLGELVRIGGRVVGIDTDGVVTIDDGTGRAAVRLAGEAVALGEQLHTGDLVNVTGTVERTAAGTLEITVDDSAGVARVPAPASLAAATGALAQASDAAAFAGTSDASRTASASSNVPLIAVAFLLAVMAAGLVALAAAGPQRRSRLVALCQAAANGLRARLQPGHAGNPHG